MLIGYARTSTLEQKAGFEAQIDALEDAGAERMFTEQVSSVAERPELEAAIDFVRAGDSLLVTKLDRLARSTRDLWAIIERLEAKEASLRVLDLSGGNSVDTRSATGRLMLTILSGVAQMEREMMLERQREGIAKAKAEGKYKGRAPTARAKSDEVLRLKSEGVGPSEIAKQTGISRASVYRILAA